MCYSMQNIATAAGVSIATAHNHIAILKKKRLFKKTAIGKFLNDRDGKKLSELMGFDYDKLLNLSAQPKLKTT